MRAVLGVALVGVLAAGVSGSGARDAFTELDKACKLEVKTLCASCFEMETGAEQWPCVKDCVKGAEVLNQDCTKAFMDVLKGPSGDKN